MSKQLYVVVLMDTAVDDRGVYTRNTAIGVYNNLSEAIGDGMMELTDYCRKTEYHDQDIEIDLIDIDEKSKNIEIRAWAAKYKEDEFHCERDGEILVASVWVLPTTEQ